MATMTRMHMSRFAAWLALACALVAYGILLRLPMYATMTTTIGGGGVTRSGQATLADVNGPGIYATLAIPVFAALLAVLPLSPSLHRLVTVIAALIATVFAILGMMTVGLFFLPTAVALILAAASSPAHAEPALSHGSS